MAPLFLWSCFVASKLLLTEDFSCASLGCNATSQPTDYSKWRWSTTGSAQAYLRLANASGGRPGSEVDFSVEYCLPPKPNPEKLGCYRSELALQRARQGELVDWTVGAGSSARWFGFANRLPANLTWDRAAPQSGPCLQMHGGGGLPQFKGLHPVLDMQSDFTGCAPGNVSCPRWTISVANGPGGAYGSAYDLGPATLGTWEDWVMRVVFSPLAERGSLQMWRNGSVVLPEQRGIATAYNDTKPPYLKFGANRGDWKEDDGRTRTATCAGIAYNALRVGDEHSSFEEVSTIPKDLMGDSNPRWQDRELGYGELDVQRG